MEFREILENRKSTRAFTGDSVTCEQLDFLLDAAVNAPNACNAQSWRFYCTLDRSLISKLSPEVYPASWVCNAGCVILIGTDPEYLVNRFGSHKGEHFAIQDTASAAVQILQAATDIGLSGCWLGAFDHDKAREFFTVPGNVQPEIILVIGKAVSDMPKRPRKPMSEVVTRIGSCENKEEAVEHEAMPFTVRGTVLKNAVFSDVNLSGANFSRAKLANVTFDDINMSQAKFNNINLEGTAFTDINMKNTTYGGLTMQGAHFQCVDMQDTKFNNPDFSRAEFAGCSLRDVKIEDCDISGLTIDGINIAELIEKYKNNKS